MGKRELLENLKRRDFPDEILKAFEQVHRENFVPREYRAYAYSDDAIPIEGGQFIAQPYTIAFMLDLLEVRDGEKILEVGAGSGYVLALLSQLCPKSKIYGIERIKALQELAEERLKEAKNVTVFHGDGTRGYKTQAPYDKILVSAFGKGVPIELLQQLADGGIMVIPIEDSIYRIRKKDGQVSKEEFPGFRFVPLKKGLEGEEST